MTRATQVTVFDRRLAEGIENEIERRLQKAHPDRTIWVSHGANPGDPSFVAVDDVLTNWQLRALRKLTVEIRESVAPHKPEPSAREMETTRLKALVRSGIATTQERDRLKQIGNSGKGVA